MAAERLSDNRAYPGQARQLERSEEAVIAGEFAAALLAWSPCAAPLIEWSDASCKARVQDWFRRRAMLLADFPPAFWFMLRCEAEGVAFLKLTFDQMAEQRGISRQAVQQEFERVITALKRHEPKVADAVWHYRDHKSYSVMP
jgi:hypothetical protein